MFEIVPNIASADEKLVNYIVSQIENNDFKVLHIDSGLDSQRTVLTCIGKDENTILDASLKLSKICNETIDMSNYSGNHPCIGALDVLPVVAYNEPEENAISLAGKVAKSISQFSPVFLYAKNSSKSLSHFRKGGLEGLKKRINAGELKFDYGDKIPKSGVSCVGARDYMIAFNVYLNTSDVLISKQIASQIREKSKTKNSIKGLKAIGWKLPSQNLTQVSTNIYDTKSTSMYEVYRKCEFLAKEYGSEVISSEIIGLVPRQSLTLNDNFTFDEAVRYLSLNKFDSFTEDKILEVAINNSGL